MKLNKNSLSDDNRSELDKLRREVAELKKENDRLKTRLTLPPVSGRVSKSEQEREQEKEQEKEKTFSSLFYEARRSSAELRAVLESIGDAVYIGTLEGITIANQTALDQLGFTSYQELNRSVGILAEEIETRDWKTKENIPTERQAFARALAGERVVQEVQVRHRQSGEVRVVRCSATPVVIDGRVIAAVAINTDITEQKKAEEALRLSEVRFRTVANLVPDLLWHNDADGRITWYNQRLFEYTGLDADAIKIEGWRTIVHPDDRDGLRASFQFAIQNGKPLNHECRIRNSEGSYHWFLVRALPVRGTTSSAQNPTITEIDSQDDTDSGSNPREVLEFEVPKGLPHKKDNELKIRQPQILTGTENATQSPNQNDQWYGAATDIQQQHMLREELERLVEERTMALSEANSELERDRERLHQLSLRLLEVQETERRFLARELHDEIGQFLTGLKFQLEINKHLLDKYQDGDENTTEQFNDTLNTVDQLSAKVRELTLNLRPTLLDDAGLQASLTNLFERYRAQTGIEVGYYYKGLEGRFAQEVETTVYRLVQEALTNIARHAQVNKVLVQLVATQKQLTLFIQDEGRGFNLEEVLARHNSTGISAMQERVGLLNGNFHLDSRPGEGTSLTIQIPLGSMSLKTNRPAKPRTRKKSSSSYYK